MLVFVYDGKSFKLSFERVYKDVTLIRKAKVKGPDGKLVWQQTEEKVKSQYPYTTVKLIALPTGNVAPVIFEKATVGCLPSDTYSHENGRRWALRELSNKLRKLGAPSTMTAAMWEAYLNRPRPKDPNAGKKQETNA